MRNKFILTSFCFLQDIQEQTFLCELLFYILAEI